MYETTATATTVKITPVTRRPRLLSVDRRPAPSPPTSSIPIEKAYEPREASFSENIPSPAGILLPHTRYIPIRSHPRSTSFPTVPITLPPPPPHIRAPASSLATSPSLSSPRTSEDDPWVLQALGNYTFCSSYEASYYENPDSRAGSQQSNHSRSSSASSSWMTKIKRQTSRRGRSGSESEHFGGWFKKFWRE